MASALEAVELEGGVGVEGASVVACTLAGEYENESAGDKGDLT